VTGVLGRRWKRDWFESRISRGSGVRPGSLEDVLLRPLHTLEVDRREPETYPSGV
jgi:hypothetical protein